MSLLLIDLARKFATSGIPAESFEVEFFRLWRSEGQSGALISPSADINECLYIVFDLAERYTSDAERTAFELDQHALRKEVNAALEKFNLT